MLIAKNFGAILSTLLRVGHLSHAFVQKLCPGKSLVAMASRWGCNGGVGSLKQARIGDALEEEEQVRRPKKQKARLFE